MNTIPIELICDILQYYNSDYKIIGLTSKMMFFITNFLRVKHTIERLSLNICYNPKIKLKESIKYLILRTDNDDNIDLFNDDNIDLLQSRLTHIKLRDVQCKNTIIKLPQTIKYLIASNCVYNNNFILNTNNLKYLQCEKLCGNVELSQLQILRVNIHENNTIIYPNSLIKLYIDVTRNDILLTNNKNLKTLKIKKLFHECSFPNTLINLKIHLLKVKLRKLPVSLKKLEIHSTPLDTCVSFEQFPPCLEKIILYELYGAVLAKLNQTNISSITILSPCNIKFPTFSTLPTNLISFGIGKVEKSTNLKLPKSIKILRINMGNQYWSKHNFNEGYENITHLELRNTENIVYRYPPNVISLKIINSYYKNDEIKNLPLKLKKLQISVGYSLSLKIDDSDRHQNTSFHDDIENLQLTHIHLSCHKLLSPNILNGDMLQYIYFSGYSTEGIVFFKPAKNLKYLFLIDLPFKITENMLPKLIKLKIMNVHDFNFNKHQLPKSLKSLALINCGPVDFNDLQHQLPKSLKSLTLCHSGPVNLNNIPKWITYVNIPDKKNYTFS